MAGINEKKNPVQRKFRPAQQERNRQQLVGKRHNLMTGFHGKLSADSLRGKRDVN